MRTSITLESVIEFIKDEGLGPYKLKQSGDKWIINFNEPTEWGTNDKKGRCGIGIKEVDGNEIVVFNGFKACAQLGDEYKGGFYKFVKLIKHLNTIEEAKLYFNEKYLFDRNIKDIFNNIGDKKYTEQKEKDRCNFESRFERFDKDKHKEYYNYLLSNRKILEKRILNLKLFVDPEQKRIIFPVYEDGELIFYSGRDITGKSIVPWLKSKGKEIYPVWNLENVTAMTVSVFEGIGDAIHVSNGVALFGVGSSEQFKKILKKGFTKIILVFDNDKPGRLAREKWANYLTEEMNCNNIYIYDYSGIKEKDFGQMAQNGIDFEINKRIFYWNDRTKILFKLGRIS